MTQREETGDCGGLVKHGTVKVEAEAWQIKRYSWYQEDSFVEWNYHFSKRMVIYSVLIELMLLVKVQGMLFEKKCFFSISNHPCNRQPTMTLVRLSLDSCNKVYMVVAAHALEIQSWLHAVKELHWVPEYYSVLELRKFACLRTWMLTNHLLSYIIDHAFLHL